MTDLFRSLISSSLSISACKEIIFSEIRFLVNMAAKHYMEDHAQNETFLETYSSLPEKLLQYISSTIEILKIEEDDRQQTFSFVATFDLPEEVLNLGVPFIEQVLTSNYNAGTNKVSSQTSAKVSGSTVTFTYLVKENEAGSVAQPPTSPIPPAPPV
jgi:hypothetical protein